MCYSAQITASYKTYVRLFGAKLSIHKFVAMFWERNEGSDIRVPRALENEFYTVGGAGGSGGGDDHAGWDEPLEDADQIKREIDRYRARVVAELEVELAAQRDRLAVAEAKLAMKETKVALESKRIATKKIETALRKLAEMGRTDPTREDARIFPGTYVPVMVMQDGDRVLMPMRYQCRPAGKPAYYDSQYPGTYNARRDNLRGFWKEQFGRTHGLLVLDSFFENLPLHRWERRPLEPGEKPRNVIVEFRPRSGQQMFVACLWSHWTWSKERDLFSFAIITDDPPPEISEAGHDRCPIAIKPGHVDAWLNPDPRGLDAMDAILDDQSERPYYEALLAK